MQGLCERYGVMWEIEGISGHRRRWIHFKILIEDTKFKRNIGIFPAKSLIYIPIEERAACFDFMLVLKQTS